VLAPAPRGTAVQVQGAAIAGSLLVPAQDGATVAGRFERLHWTLPEGGAAGATVAGGAARPNAATQPDAAASAAAAFDPAKIPPLLFEVGDLRIGNAVLGSARFRSTPVAGGMRMDEFATSGAKQRLAASGSWSGQGAAAHTRLRLDVDSDDIGALLAGLGLGGQVAGGEGKLGLDADWRGAPDAFDPKSMNARRARDARDGRLLGIEPGAGRVLALPGVAPLPWRLPLGFRDFVDKGFALDSIAGDVGLAPGTARTDNFAIAGPA